MKKNVIVLISLIIILFVVNYVFLDSLLINLFDEGEVVVVERVIDGDTVVAEDTASLHSRHENLSRGVSVRLLGINSPEKGEQYYNEAREFLEEAVINKTVILKFGKEKYDKYNRTLAYIFVDGKNINLKLVKAGFANFYFPSGRDVYYEDFKEAWEECEENLCEMSVDECADCIELEEFDYENEVVVFYNKCDFDCELTEWEIKDEGRKNFVFPDFVLGEGESVKVIVSEAPSHRDDLLGQMPQASKRFSEKIFTKGKDVVNNQNEIFWRRKDYVWTNSGDTLFLRDEKGKLVLWESY